MAPLPYSDYYAMSPAAQVLTDPVLCRCITSFQLGLPLTLYDFWVAHEPAVAESKDSDLIRTGIDRLMKLVVSHGTPKLLDQTANVRYQGHRWYPQLRTRGLRGVVQLAIKANRADMLEFALTHDAPCEEYHELWYQAIHSHQAGDLRVFEVLQAHKPTTVKRLESRTSQAKDVCLVEWFDTQYPGSVGSDNVESAAREGNLAIVQYIVENHPTIEIGTWPFKCAHQGGHFDILRYLLEKLPAQVDADFFKRQLEKGDKEMLTMFREVGGFEAHVHREATNYIQFGHLDQLERLFDEGLLTKQSEFSIDNASWSIENVVPTLVGSSSSSHRRCRISIFGYANVTSRATSRCTRLA